MPNVEKKQFVLKSAARVLAGSYFASLALPSSHSDGYDFESRAAPSKAISQPKLRILMQYAS